jgi:hypothetical protein
MAAFREDLLPARKAARVAAHLASCPRCAELDAQLAAVTAILARAPAPPMPASLPARLDAALAAEVARSAEAGSAGDAAPGHAGPGPTGPGHAGTGPTGPGHAGPGHAGPGRRAGRRPRGTSPRSLRLAAAAAAVVILAGGGYTIARVVLTGNSTGPASSSGAAGSASSAGHRSAAGLAPEAVPRAGSTAVLPVIASETHYQAGQLPDQVRAVLARYPTTGSPGQFGHAAAAARAFPGLTACLSHVTGGQRPRLVDLARYGTRPAAVIVVPVTGTSMVRVWVVGTGCSGQGSDIITRFSMPVTG